MGLWCLGLRACGAQGYGPLVPEGTGHVRPSVRVRPSTSVRPCSSVRVRPSASVRPSVCVRPRMSAYLRSGFPVGVHWGREPPPASVRYAFRLVCIWSDRYVYGT